jgi:sec-independent protein translocase protein TatB
MNFFGVGPMEFGLIAIIAVIVLGPERFPEFAVQIARAIKFLRGYADDATSELRAEFQELTKEYENLRKEMDEVRSSVATDAGSVGKEMTAVTEQMRRIAAETRPALQPQKLDNLLRDSKPIIEPGGELPPDRNGPNGANGTSH